MSRGGRPLISLQRLQIERSFILKRVVKALPSDTHCREQNGGTIDPLILVRQQRRPRSRMLRNAPRLRRDAQLIRVRNECRAGDGSGSAVHREERRTASGACVALLNQLHPLQTRMPVLADDDVVVHGNAERGGDIDDRLGHMDIGLRRRRVAGGMVVHDALETTYRIEKLTRTSSANSDRGRQ
jgi:hypothetical protein